MDSEIRRRDGSQAREREGLQEKAWPIETFFHKIVRLRNRLRVLEQQINGAEVPEVDATIAMTHIVLAAAEEGLGTCWIAAFDPQAAREVLRLPPEVVPSAFTPLGYPANTAAPKKRRPLSEILAVG